VPGHVSHISSLLRGGMDPQDTPLVPRGRSRVLPAESRLRRRRDFSAAVRQGSRSGRTLLTGHLLVPAGEEDSPPRAGFVVSRSVGMAVVRNRVRRRLRVLVREYLSSLPGGSLLVVRANPQAATARQADLAAELDLVMSTLMRRQAGALRR
jgi:ribonuclease P protein component